MNQAAKLSVLGVIVVTAIGAAVLQRTKKTPSVEKPPAFSQPSASAPASTIAAEDKRDYRRLFEQALATGVATYSWREKIDDEKLLADASYSEGYLAYLLSNSQVEWGTFIAKHRLAAPESDRFVELSARKKLAFKNARTAARAFSGGTTKASWQAFMDDVSREYDEQIKALLGAEKFSSYLTFTESGARLALEPFFIEMEFAGHACPGPAETKLVNGVALQKGKKSGESYAPERALIAFDPTTLEELSMDQLLAFRHYQRGAEAARKTQGTRAGAKDDSPQNPAREAVQAFLQRHRGELILDAQRTEAMQDKSEALLNGVLPSTEFSAALTDALGRDLFKHLIAALEKAATDREVIAAERKLKAFGTPLTAEQRKQFLAFFAANRSEGNTATGEQLSLLSASQRSILATHLRGSAAWEKLTVIARERLALR